MEPEFWHQRWEDRQIGFHQTEFNPWLQKFWPTLQLSASCRVLVPLCGKSNDMLWLAGRGHDVFGVELSESAVVEFFAEWGISPEVGEQGGFKTFTAQNVTVWVGDFFNLTAEDLKDVEAIYDRAAIVALPPELRRKYVSLLTDHIVPTTNSLLLTFEYDQDDMEGPPFSIPMDDIRSHFESRCEIEDLTSESFKFRDEIDAIEHVVRLTYR